MFLSNNSEGRTVMKKLVVTLHVRVNEEYSEALVENYFRGILSLEEEAIGDCIVDHVFAHEFKEKE